MFGKKEEVKRTNQDIKTLIGVGCVFEGNLTTSEGLTRIDGEIIGNVSGNGGVILGERGSIKGNVSLEEVIVYGRIEGDIIAKSVELKSGSRVDGNIRAEELLIEKGAVYNGVCRMDQSSSVDMSPTGSPSS